MAEGRQYMTDAPWIITIPGVALMITVWASTCSATACATCSIRACGYNSERTGMSLLELRGLTTAFQTESGEITAVEDVSFDIEQGEILGIVGESGSGKSVTALTIMGLLPQPPARIAAGSIRFAGQELHRLSDGRMQQHPRPRHRHGVPGADDLAQPGVHHRRADHGDDPRA